MHPALSIIAFTTLSGLGYGLAAALGIGLLDPADVSTKVAHLVALLLIGAGLLASTLHLGNPQRAWRALSQWRSSWLSREGVLAIATFVPLAASAVACWWSGDDLPVAGLVGAALAICTVYCTSMIYASLKSVDAWHTPLTSVCYLAFAMSGGLSLTVIFAAADVGARLLSAAAAIAIAIAWAVKIAWWKRLDGSSPTSTAETATGLGGIGRVTLFERPHINDNYLTREMGFRVARKHDRKLRVIALLAGGGVPIVLFATMATGGFGPLVSSLMALIAAVCHGLGVLAERWLFFAQARHSVMSYYGG